ncbi:hypothetical protein K435DRAFT_234335 [Dendrothele bispora CBS 962.96]|uniref:HAM1-like N-terminal domain-containing protein n=1 Tax=Dendrothele bispora (strain CBS 962.96) TaxID=1314807 RepID=A0A4S8LQ90_DENBC|nr:hypothetical protein K435DRAFT_234335 [Dendrothele bispora CBS 962.96]
MLIRLQPILAFFSIFSLPTSKPENSSQTSLVGRDLLSKGLSKAALGLAPDEERLAGVDAAHHGDEFLSKEQEEKKAKAKQVKEEARPMVVKLSRTYKDRRLRQAQLLQLLAWQ